MKEILFNKLNAWSLNRAIEFHNNSDISLPYLWEVTESGMFLYKNTEKDVRSFFFGNDGYIHKLFQRVPANDSKDFLYCTEIYELSKKSGQFRIEIPIMSEEYRGLTYSVYMRPSGHLGELLYMGLFENKLSKDELRDFIDDSTILMSHIKSLNCPCPANGLDIVNRLRDADGFFWRDLKSWEISFPDFVSKTLKEFNKSISLLINLTKDMDLQSLVLEAEEKWKTI